MFRKLIELDLAMLLERRPVITPMGRKILVRGSPGLWDASF